MPSLEHKVALITGATSGIGFAIAAHFASLGAAVVVHGREQAAAEQAAAALTREGRVAAAVAGDLRDPDVCRDIVRFAIEDRGGVHVLVNNAGVVTRGSLEDAPLPLWEEIMAVNLRAPFLCLQEAVKWMKSRGGGSIVNIGSVNAYVGAPRLGPYSVSKGALMTLTRNAAGALNRYRIRVNQLNVGWTLTENEHAVQAKEGRRADWLADAVAMMPFGRLLTPQEIAYAAAYFASDDSALITGSVLDMEQMPLGALADF